MPIPDLDWGWQKIQNLAYYKTLTQKCVLLALEPSLAFIYLVSIFYFYG